MSRIRILCDADGVLCDWVGMVLDYVQRNTGLSYAREAVNQWDSLAALSLDDHWPYFRTQCDELGLCRTMQPMLGARELWAEITRIDPHAKVCTTPMTVAWLSQRAAWLVEFGVPLEQQWQGHGKEDLTRSPGVGDGRFGYDVLIDDKVENCEAFQRAGGWAFCVAAEYNTHVAADVTRGTHADCARWLRFLTGEE